MLHDLVMKHRASLQIFDEICHLVNEYTASPDFSLMTKLPSRKSFLRSIEETYCTHGLRPTNRIVRLHDNSYVIVPVFDTKDMIISLSTDPLLMIMTHSNFAKGYNVLTGEVDMNNPCNSKYGKMHTGDAWLPTRNRYCTGKWLFCSAGSLFCYLSCQLLVTFCQFVWGRTFWWMNRFFLCHLFCFSWEW